MSSIRHRLLVPLAIASAVACRGQNGSMGPLPPGGGEPIAPAVAGPSAPAPSSPAPAPGSTATLHLEGTPAIPDQLRARLEQYLNTRSALLSDLSDDGRSILISTRFGGSNQLHRVDRPGGARTQLTFAREPVRTASFAPGNPRTVIFERDVGGDEQYQLYRLDLASQTTTLLTNGTSRNTGVVWSRDGKRFAWASTSRNGRDYDIWLADGGRPESAVLAVEGAGLWSPLAFSGDGKRLLISEYISITHSRLHLAELADPGAQPAAASSAGSRRVTTITPEAPASYRTAVLAPDGKRAYVASDRAGEFVELYEVDLVKGGWRPLTRQIRWNVEDVALSADGRTLAFVVNQGGYGSIHLLDTRSRKIRRLPGLPQGIAYALRFARKAPVLGFTLLGPTSAGDAYTYDLRSWKLTRWTESEMGGLVPARLLAPTLIEYTSFDGRKIPALYYRPARAGPFPVVIKIHGGPEAQAVPYFSPLTQLLAAERGIAVIEPNVRGSDGYGKTYLSLDDGTKREDSVKDIGALLDWVAGQRELDSKRVAVYGGSYGGYMVLASLVKFGPRLVAGICSVGISNFITFLENTADYRRDLRRVEYGDERDPDMRAFLESISPVHHADRIQSALFVAQGANDPRVPIGEAEQIVRAVRRGGQDVWYMLARDEGHGFSKKENRDTSLLLSILFLERHLGPPAPVRAGHPGDQPSR
jgi:dipeptidyl aminopeptidase/acylaminoacyl peptidase